MLAANGKLVDREFYYGTYSGLAAIPAQVIIVFLYSLLRTALFTS